MNFPSRDAFPVPVSGAGDIYVITGGRGAGKTVYCQQAVYEYRKAGFQVGGLLSPGRFDQGQKNGFCALDLVSQESRLAASAIPGEIEGVGFGRWVFDPQVFVYGKRCLLRAASIPTS